MLLGMAVEERRHVLFGLTSAALSIGMVSGGWLLGGCTMVAAGAATALAGFSAVPMTIVMLATFMFLVWLAAAAILMWRLAPRLSRTAQSGEAQH